jgi:glycosyltransferase involved in cell wall biosynthesis
MEWIWIPFAVLCTLYCLMVLGFWFGLRRKGYETTPLNKVPMPISVVIPLRNEAKNINKLLSSLVNLDYPKELFEVVLVNDNSIDEGWQIAQQWTERMKNLVLLELPQDIMGKKQALALGVFRSLHNIVVFTDADCIHPPNWLSEISDSYKQHRWCMLVAPVMIGPNNTFFQKIQALEYASLMASSLGANALGFPFLASSANLAFVKKPIGFEYSMLGPSQISGDDVFLLHSVKQKKCGNIFYTLSPDALVKTEPVKSPYDFVMQRARWASKAPAYRDWQTIAIAVIVLLFNLMIVGLMVIAPFFKPLWLLLVIAFTLKLLVDFPLLWIFLKRYHETSLLKVYLPLQLVYPFYIFMAFVLSLVSPMIWKGRKE